MGGTVVTADANTELGRMKEAHPEIFSLVEPENAESIANAITHILESTNRSSFNEVARSYSTKFLAKNSVLSKFEDDAREFIDSMARH